ncbi:MAG: DUF2007 domain-containing protein [Marinilabiliales bacterium]|nr:DUF2007 domain-containing protein [Marinilabiliales bacterium]
MENNDELVWIFTGTEVLVDLLKAELEEIGIGTIVRNDYLSGISVGFMGGTPTSIDLFIQKADLEAAQPVLDEFFSTNPQ